MATKKKVSTSKRLRAQLTSEVVCEYCGNAFETERKHARTCSGKCRTALSRKNKRATEMYKEFEVMLDELYVLAVSNTGDVREKALQVLVMLPDMVNKTLRYAETEIACLPTPLV